MRERKPKPLGACARCGEYRRIYARRLCYRCWMTVRADGSLDDWGPPRFFARNPQDDPRWFCECNSFEPTPGVEEQCNHCHLRRMFTCDELSALAERLAQQERSDFATSARRLARSITSSGTTGEGER